MVAATSVLTTTKVKKKGKKRNVSKHIVNAAAVPKHSGDSGNTGGIAIADSPLTNPSNASSQDQSSKKKKNTKKKVKDPTDTEAYLTAWKAKSGWKFNKNTQSWLIRHMYDAEKLPKHAFATMIEYLNAAGESVKLRVRDDASRRALRYQNYSTDTNKTTNSNADYSHGSQTSNDALPLLDASLANHDDAEDEEQKWKNLSDHDKRKGYKRARKVLDSILLAEVP